MNSLFDDPPKFERIALRKPCVQCGSSNGEIRQKGAQDCVFCIGCNRFQYNAPRTETGKKVRSTKTVHDLITTSLRARVLMRATGRCELCGKKPEAAALHVGHLVSVDAGMAAGLRDHEINDEENLAAFCDECNLGMGKEPVPLRVAVALVMARVRRKSA